MYRSLSVKHWRAKRYSPSGSISLWSQVCAGVKNSWISGWARSWQSLFSTFSMGSSKILASVSKYSQIKYRISGRGKLSPDINRLNCVRLMPRSRVTAEIEGLFWQSCLRLLPKIWRNCAGSDACRRHLMGGFNFLKTFYFKFNFENNKEFLILCGG